MLGAFSLSVLMESNLFIAAIVALALLSSEYQMIKRQTHYNRDMRDPRHILNRRYEFHHKSSLDFEDINRTIGYGNILATVAGCIAICVDVRWGVVILLVLYILLNMITCGYLGRKYRDKK